MGRILKVFVFLLILAIHPIFAEEILSFASWNLRYANKGDSLAGNGWSKRLEHISDVIRFNDLEVVNLQEMNEVDSVPMTNMLLKNLPGYAAVTCGDSLCKDFNPIIYKEESIRLLKNGVFWFSPNSEIAEKGWDAMYRRFCTWAKFEKNGYDFYVFNVHWDHRGVMARRESAMMSVEKVMEIAGSSTVFFAGDLNCVRKYDCYYLLEDRFWRDARENAGFVFLQDSSFNHFESGIGKKTLDHIFVTNDIVVLRYGIVRATYYDGEQWRNASDHSPIMIFTKLTQMGK